MRTAFHSPARVIAYDPHPEIFLKASQEGAQDRIDHIIKSLIFIFLLKVWTSLQYFPLF